MVPARPQCNDWMPSQPRPLRRQPSINNPVAAIQLPATRTAIRVQGSRKQTTNAITSGKVTGSSQIAGGPSCAPHRPTDTIANTWSRPETGCLSPARKPAACPCCWCAQAGTAASTRRRMKRRLALIPTPENRQRSLEGPEGAKRPNRVARQHPEEARPLNFQHAERAFEPEDEKNEEQLAHLGAPAGGGAVVLGWSHAPRTLALTMTSPQRSRSPTLVVMNAPISVNGTTMPAATRPPLPPSVRRETYCAPEVAPLGIQRNLCSAATASALPVRASGADEEADLLEDW